MYPYLLHALVTATDTVTESGGAGLPAAQFPAPAYIHANPGEAGEVVGVDDGVPTVRFFRTGTATIVGADEVAFTLPRDAHEGLAWHWVRYSLRDAKGRGLAGFADDEAAAIGTAEAADALRAYAWAPRSGHILQTELGVTIRALMAYSFRDLSGNYAYLSKAEQRIIPVSVFAALVAWANAPRAL